MQSTTYYDGMHDYECGFEPKETNEDYVMGYREAINNAIGQARLELELANKALEKRLEDLKDLDVQFDLHLF